MIIVSHAIPTPRMVWYMLSHVVRMNKEKCLLECIYEVDQMCAWLESKYNVDRDLLYRDYGQKAVAIYR